MPTITSPKASINIIVGRLQSRPPLFFARFSAVKGEQFVCPLESRVIFVFWEQSFDVCEKGIGSARSPLAADSLLEHIVLA